MGRSRRSSTAPPSPFVFLLDCAGVVAQDAPRATIEIRRPVRVSDGEAFAELRPPVAGMAGLDMALSIDFPRRRDRTAGAVAAPDAGRASATSWRVPAPSRSPQEIDQLRAAGLARGGSLENAVVVDQARVLNPAGLRMPDEFVRHKLLDAVGDLALAGAPLRGRFVAHRSGHTLNHRLLQALFADDCGVAGDHAGAAFGRRRVGRPLRAATPHGIIGAMEPIHPIPRFALVLVALLPLLGGCGGLEGRGPRSPPRRWRRSRTCTTTASMR